VIPNGEERTIKELPVFGVTAAFSLFAYIWLIIILLVISPDVVEWWEGLMTFMFFPVLCWIAYLADIGYFHKLLKMNWEKPELKMSLSPNTTQEELTEMMSQIRQKYGPGADEHMDDLLHFEFSPPPSRAAHRVRTVRQLVAGKKVLKEQFNVQKKAARLSTMATDNSLSRQASQMSCHSGALRTNSEDLCDVVGFRSEHYMIREEAGQVDIWLDRKGKLDQISTVRVYTEDVAAANGAKAGEDYDPINQIITFDVGQEEQKITIKIHQDETPEDTEVFLVRLAELEGPDAARVRLDGRKCNVVIFDCDHPGVLRFDKEEETVGMSAEPTELFVKVQREKGTSGEITCRYRAEDVTAVVGRDYEPCEGELRFGSGQASATFPLVIKPRDRIDCDEFRVVISDASAGAEFNKDTDGREDCCILTVKVLGDIQQSGLAGKILHQFMKNPDNFFAGTENWRQQFHEAIFVGGSLEEQREATVLEWTCHVLILPWKLLCACVPPTNLAGGYATFCASLILIGLMTAFIGDLATAFGCGTGIDDLTTAITIVALGTSLPDTFASKAAALHDRHADASIGNVTGSNSVNVFLGLGLPWLIAGIYWEVRPYDADDASDAWNVKALAENWPDAVLRDYPGKFVVLSTGLGESVVIYTSCALACMSLLVARRYFLGAELGGPILWKWASAAFFVCLWMLYIVLSIMAV